MRHPEKRMGRGMEKTAILPQGRGRGGEGGAMVITGDVRAFASGADVKEMVEQTAIGMLPSGRISQWDRIRRVTKPLIAAVSGWGLGGGSELGMGCDMGG